MSEHNIIKNINIGGSDIPVAKNPEKAEDPFDPKSVREAEERKTYKKKLENQKDNSSDSLPKIGKTGLNSDVSSFLEEIDMDTAVIPPNLGFV